MYCTTRKGMARIHSQEFEFFQRIMGLTEVSNFGIRYSRYAPFDDDNCGQSSEDTDKGLTS
jgi:hypothetical protein